MPPKSQTVTKKSIARVTEQLEETGIEGSSSSHVVVDHEEHEDSDDNSKTREKRVQCASEDRVKILEAKLDSIMDALANTTFSHHPRTSSPPPQPMTQPQGQMTSKPRQTT